MLSKEAFEALGRVFAVQGWAESRDPPKNRRKAEWGWRDELAATRRTRSGTRAGRSMLCHYKGGAEHALEDSRGESCDWLKSRQAGAQHAVPLQRKGGGREGQCSDRRRFCTCVHRFAQSLQQNSIDVVKENEYLARQIEPGSLRTLRVSFEGAAA